MRLASLITAQAIVVLPVLVPSELGAQDTAPTLGINRHSPAVVELYWDSQPGTTYQPLFTPAIDVFSFWSPATAPITASANQTIVNAPAAPLRFFKLHVTGVPNSGVPTARIVAPAHSETVSGLIEVFASAQDDSRLSVVSLLIDGEEYDVPVREGSLLWVVNTGHFSNGPHTLQVRALDNLGVGQLGGNPDSDSAANEVVSAPIILNFANAVRLVEPVSGFDTFVPISVRADIFPSDWNVYVEDEAGAIIRTFGGFTTDGIVETEWDGNDNLGNPVPYEKAYRVLFTLGEMQPSSPLPGGGGGTEGPPPLPGGSSFLMSSGSISTEPISYNPYGSPEYVVTGILPAVPSVFFDPEVRERIEKGLLPPLPPLSEEQLAADRINPTLVTRKVSLLEAALAPPPTLSTSTAASPPPVFNDFLVWREAPWQSGEIILARQKFTGLVTAATLNAVYANNLATLNTDIQTAALIDERLQTRLVYGGSPFVADVSADFDVLLNDLTQPVVRDFYYIGHSNGDAIGYSENSKNNGISWTRLEVALQNFIARGVPKWNGRTVLMFKKPFRFVFIDGCLSIKGGLKQAFGITPDNNNTRLGKKRRAFLGWSATTQNSIINNNQSQ